LSADVPRRVVVVGASWHDSDNDNARLRPWLVAASYMVPMSLALGDAAYDKKPILRISGAIAGDK
jgi:hypothetical protein